MFTVVKSLMSLRLPDDDKSHSLSLEEKSVRFRKVDSMLRLAMKRKLKLSPCFKKLVSATWPMILFGIISCHGLSRNGFNKENPSLSHTFDIKAPMNFNLHDASILYPPPLKLTDLGFYLPLSKGGSTLLSPSAFENIKKSSSHPDLPISSELANRVFDYENWRVVAFRLDPCQKSKKDADCQGQIRLVVQPILKPLAKEKPLISQQVFAADFAMHLIFNLSQEKVSEAIQGLYELKITYSPNVQGLPLGVHPAFLGAKRDEFASKLNSFIQSFAHEDNLSMVAFLGSAVAVTGSQPFKWSFTALKVENGLVSPFKIPNSKDSVMRFFLAEGDGDQGILPLPPLQSDSLAPALDNAKMFGEDTSYPKDAIARALRIENPKFHTVDSVDCVSCHIATTVRVPFEAQLFGAKGIESSDRYQNSKHNLKRDPNFRTGALFVHNFGFINNEAIVSQRTINEAAEVADFINSKR